MEGFVYILHSQKKDSFYIGSTINLDNRVEEHNLGRVKSTRHKTPWVLKFSKKFLTIKEARQMEYKLKKLKRRDIIERIIEEGDIKMGL